MDSDDSEDKDREPGQAEDGRDEIEVAVESCSPLGFANMNFSGHRTETVRQGPSHPRCPYPVSQY